MKNKEDILEDNQETRREKKAREFYEKYLKFNPHYKIRNFRAYVSFTKDINWRHIEFERYIIKPPPNEIFIDPYSGEYSCTILANLCSLTNIPYQLKNLVKYKKKSKRKCVLVGRGIARHNLKTKWWYNKKEGYYTNYKFDYPAFNEKYKGSPRFWREPGLGRFFGFEFEWKFPSYERKIEFANLVKSDFKPFICEKDGSLDNGSPNGPSLELITNPLTFKQFNKIERLFLAAKDHGCHIPNDNYGWHITINVCGFCNHQIRRLIYAINYRPLRKFWLSLAQRDTSKEEKDWAKFERYFSIEDVSIDTFRARHAEKDHFYAAYLRPSMKSVEIRFLKSIVDFSHFSITMDVMKKLYDWAKSDKPIEDYVRYYS